MQVQSPRSLDAMLNDMPAYGSEFAKTYANHAPMVLTALDRIGGTPEQLEGFFAHYNASKNLLPFPNFDGPKLTGDTWEAAIAQREQEPQLRVFFSAEVARLGLHEAIRTYIDRLAPGVGASAFHALMRLAYGVLREDETDVAIALAYWAATYMKMTPSLGGEPRTDDPIELLKMVAEITPLADIPIGELLWWNMAGHRDHPDFAPVVDWLKVDETTLDKMASASLALFAGTQHFAALHAVTGVHWLRLVTPYCKEPDVMLRYFWLCISSLLPEMEYPTLPNSETLTRWRARPAPDWPTIWAAARQSYDEHDISIAFSAHEEMKTYDDPLYRVAAARRLGLIPDYTRVL